MVSDPRFSFRYGFFRPRKEENFRSFFLNGPYKRLKRASKDENFLELWF